MSEETVYRGIVLYYRPLLTIFYYKITLTHRFPKFKHQTIAQRDRLVHWINSVAIARATASVKVTKDKQVAVWHCWNSFLVSIGLEHCLYLDSISKFKKNIILSTFAQAVREAFFNTGNKTILVQSTIETILSYVAQAFRSSNRQDPRLDNDGKTCFLIK